MIKIKSSNETDLECWSLCKRKIFELFIISFRTLFTELHLWYNMFICDECINILAFILERFYPNICKYFFREGLKMWAGTSSDCHCCVFASSCLCPFSIYSPARLSSSPQQVIFHKGRKDLHELLHPGFLSWQAMMRNGDLWISRRHATDCWDRSVFSATAVALSTPRWVQNIACSWAWSLLLPQGLDSQDLPLRSITEDVTHWQGQRREEQKCLEEQGEKEKLQKLTVLNWVKTERCSCWPFLLAEERGLATWKPAVHHIQARLWYWAMMW